MKQKRTHNLRGRIQTWIYAHAARLCPFLSDRSVTWHFNKPSRYSYNLTKSLDFSFFSHSQTLSTLSQLRTHTSPNRPNIFLPLVPYSNSSLYATAREVSKPTSLLYWKKPYWFHTASVIYQEIAIHWESVTTPEFYLCFSTHETWILILIPVLQMRKTE